MFRGPIFLIATLLFALAGVSAEAAVSGVGSAALHSDDAYAIHGRDELNIIVYGEKEVSQTVTVLPDGNITLPLIGEVHVGGATPAQAADTVAASLKRFIRQPQVSVVVSKEGPLEVLVLGNVKTPGKYELPSRSHLTDALASAGGLGTTDGDFPIARLANARGDVQQVSLQKLLHDGDTSQNLALADEMTVYVPSALTLNVQVLGAVDHPGDVTVHEGDRLSMAIARAGNGVNSKSDLNHITLRRVDSSGVTKTMNINLYDVLKSGDISRDPVMEKNDLVYVPQTAGGNDHVSGPANLLYVISHLFIP